MKRSRTLLCLAAMMAIGGPRNLPAAAGQYDPPDFDHPVFEVDGLSMPKKDREQAVEALAALARNFPNDPRVDADLKEKTLAIALRLDPLNPAAREAHTALSNGSAPPKTDLFESLVSIAEALWIQAARLARPQAEPDDALLAPYLMELSLLAHPDPPAARLRQYASLVQVTPPAWKKIVTLQPDENDSSVRALALARAPKPVPPPMTPGTDSPPANADGGSPTEGVAQIGLPRTEIGFVACDSPGAAVAGIARLNIRDPDPAESTLFGVFVTSDNLGNLEMKLGPERTGPPLAGTEIIESIVRKRFSVWPKNKVGELSFTPVNGDPPAALAMSLAGTLLLESAFSGTQIAPDVAVAGILDDRAAPVLGAPDSAFAEMVERAAGLPDKPYLLAPASVDVEALAGDAALPLKPQVIGFESYRELRDLVQEDKRSPKLKEAAAKFASVVDLAERMDMEKVLQNGAVKKRLEEILSLWPNHLSAKAMLARLSAGAPDSPPPGVTAGDSPPMPDATDSGSGSLSAVQSNAQIHQALMPLYNFVKDDSAAEDAGAQLARQAVAALVALKPRIDSSSQNVLLAAQRVVQGFEALVAVKPRGSSVWNQRLEDLRGVAGTYNLEQAALGTEHRLDL